MDVALRIIADGKSEVKTKGVQMDDKSQAAALKPEEAHALLGGSAVISRASFYAGIKRGDIPAIRIGRRLIIPRGKFLAWLESAGLRAETQQPAARG
jgi:hypothetical protein